MTTKKQKRLAGEERARQRDVQHQAAINKRIKEAERRKQRRWMADPDRKASTVSAVNKMRPKEES